MANIPPEVIVALMEVMTSLEELKASRAQAVDPTTMMMMMWLAAAERERGGAPVTSAAEVITRSKDLLDALDRRDVEVVASALAPGFVYFNGHHADNRDTLLARLGQRRSKTAYATERTWSDEQLVHQDDVLVFTGNVREVQGGNERHGGYIEDGTYLLQWIRLQDGWRAQLLTWQKRTTDREWYDDTFRKDRGFSHEPNQFLIETVKSTKPGAALDLAMGQGRNALHLASEGWSVTGVDMSDEGLRIAREQAAERGLSLETINANINEWDFGEDRFDLVTMLYAGDHAKWVDKIKASLRDGGLFVVEGWARESPDSPFGFGEGQLAKLFAGYEILHDETVDGAPDWAWDEGKLVRFVARKR